MNLTKPQKLIYDMEKYVGGSINVICGVMLTDGEKEIAAMQAAVNEIFHLNDSLRTRIVEDDGEASQYFAEYAPQEVEVLRFESKAALDEYANSYAKVPFDFHGQLCEIKVVVLPEKSGILVKFHHIVGDAWTIALIGTQFNALLNGETPEPNSYADYIAGEGTYLESNRYAKDRTFFLEQFQKCEEVTYLSEKESRSVHQRTESAPQEYYTRFPGFLQGRMIFLWKDSTQRTHRPEAGDPASGFFVLGKEDLCRDAKGTVRLLLSGWTAYPPDLPPKGRSKEDKKQH